MPLRLPRHFMLVGLLAAALLHGCDRGQPGSSGATPPADAAAAKAARPNAQAAAMTITTMPVMSRQLVRTVPATGSMFPWQEVVISAEVGGYRVAEVLVDVGSAVTQGQPLVRLSTDMLNADLNSKRAALRSAEAGEINAAAALRRGESIATSGALSAADLDRLKADHIATQARVDTAQSDLHTAELRLRYGTVPASGAVTVP
jgi:multidrug efflux pump subunit AcrA (membrane-fusion protein)